jgi:hypothetical protein
MWPVKKAHERPSDSDRPPGGKPGVDRNLYWILGGLVVAGAVSWWRWLRSVREYR